MNHALSGRRTLPQTFNFNGVVTRHYPPLLSILPPGGYDKLRISQKINNIHPPTDSRACRIVLSSGNLDGLSVSQSRTGLQPALSLPSGDYCESLGHNRDVSHTIIEEMFPSSPKSSHSSVCEESVEDGWKPAYEIVQKEQKIWSKEDSDRHLSAHRGNTRSICPEMPHNRKWETVPQNEESPSILHTQAIKCRRDHAGDEDDVIISSAHNDPSVVANREKNQEAEVEEKTGHCRLTRRVKNLRRSILSARSPNGVIEFPRGDQYSQAFTANKIPKTMGKKKTVNCSWPDEKETAVASNGDGLRESSLTNTRSSSILEEKPLLTMRAHKDETPSVSRVSLANCAERRSGNEENLMLTNEWVENSSSDRECIEELDWQNELAERTAFTKQWVAAQAELVKATKTFITEETLERDEPAFFDVDDELISAFDRAPDRSQILLDLRQRSTTRREGDEDNVTKVSAAREESEFDEESSTLPSYESQRLETASERALAREFVNADWKYGLLVHVHENHENSRAHNITPSDEDQSPRNVELHVYIQGADELSILEASRDAVAVIVNQKSHNHIKWTYADGNRLVILPNYASWSPRSALRYHMKKKIKATVIGVFGYTDMSRFANYKPTFGYVTNTRYEPRWRVWLDDFGALDVPFSVVTRINLRGGNTLVVSPLKLCVLSVEVEFKRGFATGLFPPRVTEGMPCSKEEEEWQHPPAFTKKFDDLTLCGVNRSQVQNMCSFFSRTFPNDMFIAEELTCEPGILKNISSIHLNGVSKSGNERYPIYQGVFYLDAKQASEGRKMWKALIVGSPDWTDEVTEGRIRQWVSENALSKARHIAQSGVGLINGSVRTEPEDN